MATITCHKCGESYKKPGRKNKIPVQYTCLNCQMMNASWIPVTERLPKRPKGLTWPSYLISKPEDGMGCGYVYVAHFNSYGKWVSIFGASIEPTAWMPLPDTYH